MIKRYNTLSLAIAIPGLLAQIGGRLAQDPQDPQLGPYVLMLLGTAMLLIGFAFYAKAKGRHPAWCLFAFLSLIGLIVLGLLKDKSGVNEV